MVRSSSIAVCLLAAALVLVAAAAGAGNAGSTLTGSEPVSATLSAASCPALGTDITLTGVSRFAAHLSFDASGLGHLAGADAITGTAVGADGSTYRFNYHDAFSAPFTGFPATISVTDHFVLVGSGGQRIHTFFTATIVVADFESEEFLSFEPHVVIGDPEHCDPL
jgi:hypothetical protein